MPEKLEDDTYEAEAETSPQQPAGSLTALEVRGIGRRNPKGEGWLIRDVSLTLNFGDRLGVLGPSGAGKTVLLRAIAMLDPIDAGTIRWQGQRVRGDAMPRYRRQVIYLHQRPALGDGTVEDNLRLPFTLQTQRDRRFDRERTCDLLAALGRDAAFLSKPSRSLSGGEGQIVALVRALQLEPAALLLDEPTASLDPPTAQAAERVLDHWLTARGKSRALVWVSHDLDQTSRMTERQIHLGSGPLVPEDRDG
jgi:putative ABC transport system ATP-binding protein